MKDYEPATGDLPDKGDDRMESKVSEAVLKTGVKGNMKERHGRKEVGMKKYDAISKDGDILELSKKAKKLGGPTDKEVTISFQGNI